MPRSAQIDFSWSGQIVTLHPRAELREHQSVFVAQIRLENPDGVLRPGMKGQAKIYGRAYPLGWNLFHRPLEWLRVRMGW